MQEPAPYLIDNCRCGDGKSYQEGNCNSIKRREVHSSGTRFVGARLENPWQPHEQYGDGSEAVGYHHGNDTQMLINGVILANC